MVHTYYVSPYVVAVVEVDDVVGVDDVVHDTHMDFADDNHR